MVYTAALLLAPLPVMPFAPGTREFAWAVGACGTVLAAASYYAARGEWRLEQRGPLGFKLLATSLVTLAFGMALVAGSVVLGAATAAAGIWLVDWGSSTRTAVHVLPEGGVALAARKDF